MHLVEINDQKIWDEFLTSQPWAQFAQSWAWGEFQKAQGHSVKRFQLQGDKGEVLLAAQLIRYERRLVSGYWFVPRGPVFSGTAKGHERKLFEEFLTQLLEQKLPGRTLFYRFEPLLTLIEGQGVMPPRMRRNHAMNPASTIVLDLAKSEEELLAAMHPKTRYNIRVAEKHGVTVREDHGPEDFETFLVLLKETGERDEFAPQSATYLRAMWKVLSSTGMARLHLAEAQGKILAVHLAIAYGDTVTYLHGASSSEARNVMAPYALHWASICEAKREGYRTYDFWGSNPESKASYYYKPAWEGITRFKEGWGGVRVDLVGTWDLPINRLLYRLAFPEGLVRG